MISNTVQVAPRPGTFLGSVVSSFIVKVTSHPQNTKIDREMPAAKAEKLSTPAGLNICRLMGVWSKGWFEVNAMTANSKSTATWNATKPYWKALVAFKPR
ncbi:hypothetical protein D3C74_433670 [compost metagenome]